MMKKIILFSVCLLATGFSFAQSTKISKLAKKHAQALCECPSMGMIETFSMDFMNKKISVDEFQQGLKMAQAEMVECLRPLNKELKKLSESDFKLMKQESEKYRNELCPFKEEKK